MPTHLPIVLRLTTGLLAAGTICDHVVAQTNYTPYAFTTLAGLNGASVGSADGYRTEARFSGPGAVARDAAGNLYIADTLNHTIRKLASNGLVTTFAGRAGEGGDADGTGAAARFRAPGGVAVAANGTIYVADTENHEIRQITPDGVVTTLAGDRAAYNPTQDLDGTGSAATFRWPRGLVLDSHGDLIVLQVATGTFRKVTPTGVVTTVTAWSIPGIGGPSAFALDADDNVYAAYESNHTIRRITPVGDVSIFAGASGEPGSADGSGAVARFNRPYAVAVDATGHVCVAEQAVFTLRRIAPDGTVATIAGLAGRFGSADGPGANARFSYALALTGTTDGVLVAEGENNTIRHVSGAGVTTTLAGAARGFGYVDGDRVTARFDSMEGVAVDRHGNVYVGDTSNTAVRKIVPGGMVSTLAGGYPPFHFPDGLDTDADDNVYVADGYGHQVMRITPAGTVTKLAGITGNLGHVDGPGDTAQFNYPHDVTVDGNRNVYVADSSNHVIRLITPAGVVSTVAGEPGSPGSTDGTGSVARFNEPFGLAVDAAGNLFVADAQNHTIRRVTSAGVVSTMAGLAGNRGSTDGTGSAARFDTPTDVAVDAAGNLFVADSGNHTIRRITPAGVVTTIAGVPGTQGWANGTGAAATFRYPLAVDLDEQGRFYVAEANNYAIRVGVPATTSRLVNISTRASARPGDGTLIPGFTITGPVTGTKAVLIRAVGPGLAGQSVSGLLPEPTLSVYDSDGQLIASNTGWSSVPAWGTSTVPGSVRPAFAGDFSDTGAFALTAGSADCAMVLNLPPGTYTAHVTGVADTTGIALAEVYEVDPADTQTAINISTRAHVGTGESVAAAGFVIHGSAPATVLLRGVGPGLVDYGLDGLLAQPVLTLFDDAGLIIATNTGWANSTTGGTSPVAAAFRAATAADMVDTGAFDIPPGSADCAMVVTLPPGLYTAHLSGVGGSTGLAIVEAYRMP